MRRVFSLHAGRSSCYGRCTFSKRRDLVVKKISLMVAALLLCVSTSSWAASREGHFQLGGGAGLAFNPPVRFDLNIGGEYFFWENIGIGMNIDIFFRGPTAFLFQPFARYHFDIASAPEWVPYVGGGVGVGVNTNGNGALDIMIPNFGVQYELLDGRLFLGTDMSVHVVTNFDNTDWDFRWLFITAHYRF
jgi:hypothetical protein